MFGDSKSFRNRCRSNGVWHCTSLRTSRIYSHFKRYKRRIFRAWFSYDYKKFNARCGKREKTKKMPKTKKTNTKKVIEELARLAFMETEDGTGIKISEKMKALELLCKCLDMFETKETPDNEVKVSVRVEE